MVQKAASTLFPTYSMLDDISVHGLQTLSQSLTLHIFTYIPHCHIPYNCNCIDNFQMTFDKMSNFYDDFVFLISLKSTFYNNLSLLIDGYFA